MTKRSVLLTTSCLWLHHHRVVRLRIATSRVDSFKKTNAEETSFMFFIALKVTSLKLAQAICFAHASCPDKKPLCLHKMFIAHFQIPHSSTLIFLTSWTAHVNTPLEEEKETPSWKESEPKQCKLTYGIISPSHL